jgi:hypothetical protein
MVKTDDEKDAQELKVNSPLFYTGNINEDGSHEIVPFDELPKLKPMSKEDIEWFDIIEDPEALNHQNGYIQGLKKLHNSIMQPVIERCKKALEATNER